MKACGRRRQGVAGRSIAHGTAHDRGDDCRPTALQNFGRTSELELRKNFGTSASALRLTTLIAHKKPAGDAHKQRSAPSRTCREPRRSALEAVRTGAPGLLECQALAPFLG